MESAQQESKNILKNRVASEPPSAHSYRGIVIFMLGLLVFACMDSTTKYLVTHYNVPLVVAIRYIVTCVLMGILLAPTHGKALIQTQRTGLVMVRAVCLAGASLLLGMAFQRLPVAEATAIAFLSPLLVVLVAGRVLGERVGMLGWLAAVTGFIGILFIVRPGGGLDPIGILFALLAVLTTAAYQLLSRMLANTEQTIPMLFIASLVGTFAFGLLLPWSWGGPEPTLLQMLLFLAVGVLGGLGHFLFTAAHRHAPASLLAPMMYVQLVWASVLGWLVFGHVPDPMSMIGMCIVTAAGVMTGLKSHLARRTMAEPIE